MKGKERLAHVALERGLRKSTIKSYETLLRRIGAWDEDLSMDEAMDRLFNLENVNVRRATVIALRSVYGWKIKIPKGIPRRYDLPDETTLRLALMQSPYEARGLLMMYAGLRLGEACAITHKDLYGDRLNVDKQVQQLPTGKGQPMTCLVGPVKSSVASVIVPWHLVPIINSLNSTDKPDAVRESFRRAGRKVGIHLNPHQLRHFYATYLISNGVPMNVVSAQMRHSDVAVTLRTYAQVDTGKTIHDLFD